ncbi:hypothetical protein IM739_13250 [Rhizobium sp. SL42]|nr:hypothetical protein IM739_13250 [Rhizobium sp. SL42]
MRNDMRAQPQEPKFYIPETNSTQECTFIDAFQVLCMRHILQSSRDFYSDFIVKCHILADISVLCSKFTQKPKDKPLESRTFMPRLQHDSRRRKNPLDKPTVSLQISHPPNR